MTRFLTALASLLLPLLPASAQSVALNDEFATRHVLSGELPLSWSGYAGELTLEPLEDCSADPECEISGSMWFEWTAPEAGIYAFRASEPFSIGVLAAPPLTEPQVPSRDLAWTSSLTAATAGQRFWIILAHYGDPIPDKQASLQISRVTPAPSTKETAASLPATASVEIRQPIDGDGWWRWRAPSAGTWRVRIPSGYSFTTSTVLREDGSMAGEIFTPFEVSAGEELFLHSTAHGMAWTELLLEPFAPPQNLSPATARPLIADANGAGLSFEALGEPPPGSQAPPVWFSWVATRDGVAGFMPFYPMPVFKVYRDDDGALTQIDAGIDGQRAPWAVVYAGQRFLMSLPSYPQTINIRVDYLPARGSDSFAKAPALDPMLPHYVRDVFTDATVEQGEPGLVSVTERTRWWKLTPAVDAILSVTGARMNIYTGNSFESLTRVFSHDHTTTNPPLYSSSFRARAGTLYHVQVFDSPSYDGLQNFTIAVERGSGHDNFADAAVIPNPLHSQAWNPRYTYASFALSTAEAGEPPAAPGTPPGRTVWMRWTAGFTGRVMMTWQTMSSLDPSGGTSEPRLAVWKGNSLASLERVPTVLSNWAQWPTAPAFDTVAGVAYSFQIDAPPNFHGYYLSLTPVFADPGASDSFAARLPMTELSHFSVWQKTTRRATFEPGESTDGLPVPPAGFTSGSYWGEWTAPRSGVWRFYIPRGWNGSPRAFTFYRGSLTGGKRIAVIDSSNPGPLYLSVNAGESIAVGNIVLQYASDTSFDLALIMPQITPAVPGIALAKWYGLPSPANLNAAYSSDGIPLLLKHALGLDPLRNSLPGGDDPNAAAWPLLTVTPGGEPALTFRSAAPFLLANGVDLSGEISRDLLTWLPAPETTDAGLRSIYVPSSGPNGFLRLKASLR